MNWEELQSVSDLSKTEVEALCIEEDIGERRDSQQDLFCTKEFSEFFKSEGWKFIRGRDGMGLQNRNYPGYIIRWQEPVAMIVGHSFVKGQSLQKTVDDFNRWKQNRKYID